MPARLYEADAGGLKLRVRLTPRGGRDSIDGTEVLSDGRAVLKARVRAAPEKGLANAALETLVAGALRVPRSAVSIIAGGTGRTKILKVGGEPGRLAALLESLL